ncbi:hypothetical protein GFS24_24475 [Chitinophaga sp. SYP-B3965]|uniref:hypothetical protein n=1 Tax=Chitinophaga sp. SYP-B3965 TaxID=2663120 RepID=UPI001299A425|nr:hypothetical protein [Chitinophaga sp. SYP-B3965]MRG48294.1 hypothetical protein [Chitinophaga sp. SYP-B3965]
MDYILKKISSNPTKEELILLYQEYAKKAVLADQTDLINMLLLEKRSFKIKRIYNLYPFGATHGTTKKLVYQWLLIAPWFANELMKRKEIIFYVCGCCYWGTAHGQDKDETLLRIYADIATFDLTKSA